MPPAQSAPEQAPQTPHYPAPSYPSGQPVPYPAYAPPAGSGGGLSWALGFLAYAFPFVGAIAAGISMASVYRTVARRGVIAEENARSAANWGLTFLLATIVLPSTQLILFAVVKPSSDELSSPLIAPFVIYLLIAALHAVLTITGTVRASTGRVFRVPFAIPFIRRAR